MEPETGTVFVIDDDADLRNSLARLLQTVQIPVQTFSTAREFLAVYKNDPGCVLIDVRMPGMSGIELQKTLIERGATIPVIIMTGHADVPMAVDALKRGAMDFIEKPFRAQVMMDRIRQALETDRQNRAEAGAQTELQARYDKLTDKEKEVVELVVGGMTNKEIAAQRGVSSQAIDATRNRAMKKIGAASIQEMVQFVAQLKGS